MAVSVPGRAPVAGAGDLFQLLRDGHARTRSELADMTGMARSTISSRVEHLLGSGLVAPAGEAASTGGRPPARFAFNPAARLVVAADLGVTHGVVELTDLAGTVLAQHREPIRIDDGPEHVLRWVTRTASRLVGEVGRPVTDVVGTGIGVPGPVEHGSGRPVSPPIMPGWDGADVPALVGAHLPGTVLVDNDVNLMALGEHATGWAHAPHLLFIKVATGIGAGVVSNGDLNRGAVGAAGDLGHVRVPTGNDTPCPCGNTGCLEVVAGGRAIATSLQAAGVPASGSEDVVALVQSGSVPAVRAVRQAGRDLGEVLATCVSLLNPSVIVVGGSMARVGEHLLAGIREVVYGRSLPLATQALRIVPSRVAERAGVVGACTMVVRHTLSPDVVDATGLL